MDDFDSTPWRERILRRVLTGALILGGIVGVAFGVSLTVLPNAPDTFAVVLAYLAYLMFWPLRFVRRLSFPWRASGFVLAATLGSLSAGIANGHAPGPILAGALAVVLAGLLLGPRALLITLGATAGSVAYSTHVHLPGPLAGSKLITVLTSATDYAAVSGVIALIVYNVVSSIDAARRETQEALDGVRAEQQRRAEMEAKLNDTRQVLERSQRLETVGRLAGGVAHDFNNALQIILMWSECLRDDPDDEGREEGLERIHEAADHASLLTQQLLAFGRRQVSSPRAVNLSDLVRRLESSLRRLFPESVSLEVVAPDPATVFADEAQLTQVALNLALNARDALPASGGRVELRVSVDSGEHPAQVHLEIRDNGHGMDEQTCARIFEPFFTTKGDRGSGLGLPTVRDIVVSASGTLSVDTSPGRGTSFHVFLPAHKNESPRATPRPKLPKATRGGTVLLAEDEAPVRRVLHRTLSDAGYDVLVAEDGEAALAIAREPGTKIDVLCTDGIMPGMATGELISRVQELHPGASVIVCSGYLEEDLVRQNILKGEYAFLTKPMSATTLLLAVEAAMPDRRAPRPASLSPAASA